MVEPQTTPEAAQLAALLRPAHPPGVTLAARRGNYLRHDDGTWRYALSGEPVPGARDVTLAERYSAAPRVRLASDTYLLVDRAWIVRPELAWCSGEARDDLPLDLAPDDSAVPLDAFTARGSVVVDIHAPELHLDDMLTIADVARATGVQPLTIRAYRSRDQMPAPAALLGEAPRFTPLWPRPIIRHWAAQQLRRHRH